MTLVGEPYLYVKEHGTKIYMQYYNLFGQS